MLNAETRYDSYRGEEPETIEGWKFVGLALLTIFTAGFALPILQSIFVATSLKRGYWSSRKPFGVLAIVATWIAFFAFVDLLVLYGLWALWLFVFWIIGFLVSRAKK